MDEKDIPLSVKIEFPDLVIFCTDDAQERLERILLKLHGEIGKHRFCAEVASTIKSLKREIISERQKNKKL